MRLEPFEVNRNYVNSVWSVVQKEEPWRLQKARREGVDLA